MNELKAVTENLTYSSQLYEILYEAIQLEIQTANWSDEEMEKLMSIMASIEVSGTYLFMTAEGFEMVATAVANHLPVRQFVLGLFERINLLKTTYDTDRYGKPYVDWFNEKRTGTASAIYHWLDPYIESISVSRDQYITRDSILTDDIKSSLRVSEDLARILAGNRWLVVLYLALFSGAYRNALRDIVAESNTGN